jgi:hypothetical protein
MLNVNFKAISIALRTRGGNWPTRSSLILSVMTPLILAACGGGDSATAPASSASTSSGGSSAPAPVSVPSVVGLTQAAATTAITGAGLTVGTVTTQSSATVASGLVISESATAGTSVSSGSAVSLVLSSGAAISAASESWTWVSGSDRADTLAGDAFGVYGTLGVAAATNVPGARQSAVTWIDHNGDLWLFGGFGCGPRAAGACNTSYGGTVQGAVGQLNDLWKFTPSTGQWTWVHGTPTLYSPSFLF